MNNLFFSLGIWAWLTLPGLAVDDSKEATVGGPESLLSAVSVERTPGGEALLRLRFDGMAIFAQVRDSNGRTTWAAPVRSNVSVEVPRLKPGETLRLVPGPTPFRDLLIEERSR